MSVSLEQEPKSTDQERKQEWRNHATPEEKAEALAYFETLYGCLHDLYEASGGVESVIAERYE